MMASSRSSCGAQHGVAQRAGVGGWGGAARSAAGGRRALEQGCFGCSYQKLQACGTLAGTSKGGRKRPRPPSRGRRTPAMPPPTHLDRDGGADDGLGGHALARPRWLAQEAGHPVGLAPGAAGVGGAGRGGEGARRRACEHGQLGTGCGNAAGLPAHPPACSAPRPRRHARPPATRACPVARPPACQAHTRRSAAASLEVEGGELQLLVILLLPAQATHRGWRSKGWSAGWAGGRPTRQPTAHQAQLLPRTRLPAALRPARRGRPHVIGKLRCSRLIHMICGRGRGRGARGSASARPRWSPAQRTAAPTVRGEPRSRSRRPLPAAVRHPQACGHRLGAAAPLPPTALAHQPSTPQRPGAPAPSR